MDEGFVAFNEEVVVFIDIYKNEAKKIIENKDLPPIQNEGYPIIDKVGFYKDYLTVRAYQFAQISDEQKYKLYLIDNSAPILEIDVTAGVYFPNFKS